MELSPEEIAEFTRAFMLLNGDDEGTGITIRDLDNALNELGKHYTEKELQSKINEMDLDGNGFVGFDNFLKSMTIRMCSPPDDDDLRDAFRIFDKDNTGYIGPSELRQVVMKLNIHMTEEDCEELIQLADTDGDGKVNYEEFADMMTPRPK